MGTGFGCRLAGMETMFVSYTIVLRGFLSFCCTVLAVSATGVCSKKKKKATQDYSIRHKHCFHPCQPTPKISTHNNLPSYPPQ